MTKREYIARASLQLLAIYEARERSDERQFRAKTDHAIHRATIMADEMEKYYAYTYGTEVFDNA